MKLKFPNSRIAVSVLTHREDLDLSAKLHDANESLKSLSESNNFTFTDNSIIDNSCLNSSKLHLNSKGSSLLARRCSFLMNMKNLSSVVISNINN